MAAKLFGKPKPDLQTSQLISQIIANAKDILDTSGNLKKAEREIESAMLAHETELLEKGDKEFAKDLNQLCSDLRRIGIAEIIVFHRIIDEGIAIYQRNKLLKEDVPELKKLSGMIEEQISGLMELADKLGEKLEIVGKEE